MNEAVVSRKKLRKVKLFRSVDIFICVYITYFQNPDRFLIDLTCTVKLFFKFYDKSVQVILVLYMVFLSQPDEY